MRIDLAKPSKSPYKFLLVKFIFLSNAYMLPPNSLGIIIFFISVLLYKSEYKMSSILFYLFPDSKNDPN